MHIIRDGQFAAPATTDSPPLDTSPAPMPQRVVLTGRDVEIVALDPARHGDSLFEKTGRSEHDHLWTYMHDGPFADRAAFDGALSRWTTTSDPFTYAILERASGAAAGKAALMRIDPANRVIEVGGIMLAPSLQRTRAATEAMYLLARYVFETLGYRRYEWKCNAMHGRSRAAALRLGFTFEGIFRQHMIVKGVNRDTAWYSMIDAEWPARKARLERWLAPENFDERGGQRVSLSAM